ncbi:hypothetical protein [Enterococcus lactis]|uniref:hypothetical protein n=1 Tax=Enterococcus lactis TaxID=357441 RepID=UPI001CF3E9F7|nr:hypothetical protein [Enterococcus lactis]MCA6745674.1 hypothetical protein [Enterococcus lactis]
MLKHCRKGFCKVIKGKNSADLIFEWKESNLINVRGKNGSGKTERVMASIDNSRPRSRALVITDEKNHYKGIRTIEKKYLTDNDLKVVDDILNIYPDFNLVVFDETIPVTEIKGFYQSFSNLANKYEEVLFVWITEENSNSKSAFFSEKNAFLHSI